MTDEYTQDVQAKAWLNDCAFVAENMKGLGHTITEQEAYWFQRIAQVCTACMVGDEWARFRRLLPKERSRFLMERIKDLNPPRVVVDRYENAMRDWIAQGVKR